MALGMVKLTRKGRHPFLFPCQITETIPLLQIAKNVGVDQIENSSQDLRASRNVLMWNLIGVASEKCTRQRLDVIFEEPP